MKKIKFVISILLCYLLISFNVGCGIFYGDYNSPDPAEVEATSVSPTGTMAYLAEKDRVYWQLKINPTLADNYNIDDVDWFYAWKSVDENIRKKYIEEAIRLFKNRRGE